VLCGPRSKSAEWVSDPMSPRSSSSSLVWEAASAAAISSSVGMRNRAPQWGHWPALPFKLGGPLSLWPLGQRKTKTSLGDARFLPLPIAGVIRDPLISTELPPPTAVVDSLGTTNGA